MVISAISNSYAKITRGYNFPSQWFWKIHVKYLGKIEFAELISNPEKKASPSLKFWGLVSFTALSMRKISTSFERILNFSSKPVNGLLMVYWWSTDGLLLSHALELAAIPVYPCIYIYTLEKWHPKTPAQAGDFVSLGITFGWSPLPKKIARDLHLGELLIRLLDVSPRNVRDKNPERV